MGDDGGWWQREFVLLHCICICQVDLLRQVDLSHRRGWSRELGQGVGVGGPDLGGDGPREAHAGTKVDNTGRGGLGRCRCCCCCW